MLFLYRLSIYLYAFLVRIASWYQPKAKLFIEGRKGLLLKIKVQMADENRPRIWMHCSSLGEFEQGRPLIESLRKQYPNFAIILTFFLRRATKFVKNTKVQIMYFTCHWTLRPMRNNL